MEMEIGGPEGGGDTLGQLGEGSEWREVARSILKARHHKLIQCQGLGLRGQHMDSHINHCQWLCLQASAVYLGSYKKTKRKL